MSSGSLHLTENAQNTSNGRGVPEDKLHVESSADKNLCMEVLGSWSFLFSGLGIIMLVPCCVLTSIVIYENSGYRIVVLFFLSMSLCFIVFGTIMSICWCRKSDYRKKQLISDEASRDSPSPVLVAGAASETDKYSILQMRESSSDHKIDTRTPDKSEWSRARSEGALPPMRETAGRDSMLTGSSRSTSAIHPDLLDSFA